VGHREFRTRINGNMVSVYYPMDRDEYKRNINKKGNNSKWLRYGDKTLLGFAKAVPNHGTEKHPSVLMFRHLRKVKMDTVEKGEISNDFAQNGRPLIPIIFCHGISSNRTLHSGACKDFASHGYIVFALDHLDTTSTYTETNEGVGSYYNNKFAL
jgi:hypothetical protein